MDVGTAGYGRKGEGWAKGKVLGVSLGMSIRSKGCVDGTKRLA
jgi:hypothetical protein